MLAGSLFEKNVINFFFCILKVTEERSFGSGAGSVSQRQWCGSGILCLFDPLDPWSGMGKKSGSASGMEKLGSGSATRVRGTIRGSVSASKCHGSLTLLICIPADGGGPEPRGWGEGDGEHAAGLPGPLHPAEAGGGASQEARPLQGGTDWATRHGLWRWDPMFVWPYVFLDFFGPKLSRVPFKGLKSLEPLEKSRFFAKGPFRICEMAPFVIFKGWFHNDFIIGRENVLSRSDRIFVQGLEAAVKCPTASCRT